ncbi:MAG TPA: HAMP domain-containing sensor histidine kinase, partial [Vicinamibacteria bacterium]|nr:HAMP domain-containing sensor histidine kinase [Vicinamibacteria bacterium]
MKAGLEDLTEEYAAALREYLEGGGESPLFRAYQLGRDAVSSGLGVLEVAALHQEALVRDLLRMLAPGESSLMAKRASEFFAEALAPFEVSRRGFQEANSVLLDLNRELERRVEAALEAYRTAQDKLDERRRMEALKDEFISLVSHELKTPLTSIHGALGLVSTGVGTQLPGEARRLLDIAYRNSRRLARLVDNVLDLQKIESGTLTFDMRAQPLAPLLEQAVEANQSYAAPLGVTLALGGAPPDVQVTVDGDRVIQVLTNLLSNAAKFSPSGETVTVTAALHGVDVRVAVADRGPGIPEGFRSRVFQRFAQADSSTTRARGGTGLGLSISKAIVERMGGRIG